MADSKIAIQWIEEMTNTNLKFKTASGHQILAAASKDYLRLIGNNSYTFILVD